MHRRTILSSSTIPSPKRHQESNGVGWGGDTIAVERVEKKV